MGMKLTGIFADIPTPFAFDGSLYAKKVEQNIARYNLLQLRGYVLSSALGEGSALTSTERAELWRLAKAASAADKTVIAGLPELGLEPALEEIDRAAEAGCDAVVLPVPRWPAEVPGEGSPASLYLRSLADRAALPLIVQSGDSHRAQLTPEQVAEITARDQVVGIYEPSGHIEQLQGVREACGDGAAVLTGAVASLDLALAGPAAGAILGVAAAVPYHCLNITDAVRKREHEAAEQLRARLTPAGHALQHEMGVAGLKWAMDLRGYYGGPPRLPLTVLSAAAKAKLEGLLEDLPN